MLSIALTGGIASGKSTVLKEFSKYFPTIDCDKIAHCLYKNKKVCKAITAYFGTYSRKELSSIVFSSKPKRKRLESILHPLVLREIKKKTKNFERSGKKVVIIDVPLLFETSFAKFFQLTILVTCKKGQQIQRLMMRSLSRKESIQRISSQMPEKQKRNYADFVIDNSKSLRETKEQVLALVNFFKMLPH